MKKLAGYGIIAGLIGAALGVFFLIGGSWESLAALVLTVGLIGAWVVGVMLGSWLWDNVHWSLGALVWVLVVVVAPLLILPLVGFPWWLVYALYGFCAAMLGVVVGVGLLWEYAMDLIKGER